MECLDIYPDKYGRLVLQKYDLNKNSNKTTIYDNSVEEYLRKLNYNNIEEIFDVEEKNGFMIKCSDLVIKLNNVDKLNNKNEKHLNPLLIEVQNANEKKKISILKKSKEEGHKPKVTRENKHSNTKVIGALATLCAASMVASGITISNFLNLVNNKENNYPNQPKMYDTGSLIGSNSNFSPLGDEKPVEPTESIIPFIFLEYEDLSDTPKVRNTREEYGDLIEKYSNMYGLDSNLMIAIAAQESGKHNPVKNKTGATGLMQIQNGVWVGNEIKAYNFEKGDYDKFTVTEEMLSDLEKNIQLGCMYFQNCLSYYNYNIPLAIQNYNYGYGYMKSVVDFYANCSGKTSEEVVNDQCDIGWTDYRDIVDVGSSVYLNGVLSWMGNKNVVTVTKPDNTTVKLAVNRSIKEKGF